MTDMEMLFEIELHNGEILDHDPPGQFVQLSLFGAGEAPISVCSSPSRQDRFELCIRKAGKMTKLFHRLAEGGDEVGIRGPFGGVGFPTNLLKGHDLIFVAGGLGIAPPLRSLINYVIDNRRDFGKVSILLGGCKTPSSMLFGNEIQEWNKRADINFACTIDKSAPDWAGGNVGLITSLIPPSVTLEPNNTYAVVCGPPVMYRFVVEELIQKKNNRRNGFFYHLRDT